MSAGLSHSSILLKRRIDADAFVYSAPISLVTITTIYEVDVIRSTQRAAPTRKPHSQRRFSAPRLIFLMPADNAANFAIAGSFRCYQRRPAGTALPVESRDMAAAIAAAQAVSHVIEPFSDSTCISHYARMGHDLAAATPP